MIDVENVYKRYKVRLNFRRSSKYSIAKIYREGSCSICKDLVHSGSECFIIRDQRGEIERVVCSSCIKNLLRLYKAAVDLENTPIDNKIEELKRSNDLIEVVRWYIHPVEDSEVESNEENNFRENTLDFINSIYLIAMGIKNWIIRKCR